VASFGRGKHEGLENREESKGGVAGSDLIAILAYTDWLLEDKRQNVQNLDLSYSTRS